MAYANLFSCSIRKLVGVQILSANASCSRAYTCTGEAAVSGVGAVGREPTTETMTPPPAVRLP